MIFQILAKILGARIGAWIRDRHLDACPAAPRPATPGGPRGAPALRARPQGVSRAGGVRTMVQFSFGPVTARGGWPVKDIKCRRFIPVKTRPIPAGEPRSPLPRADRPPEPRKKNGWAAGTPARPSSRGRVWGQVRIRESNLTRAPLCPRTPNHDGQNRRGQVALRWHARLGGAPLRLAGDARKHAGHGSNTSGKEARAAATSIRSNAS